MAKSKTPVTVRLIKKSSTGGKQLMAAGTVTKAAVGDTIDQFNILDTEDGHYTVHGHTVSGKNVDLTDVATLTATSSDPTVFTASPPVGMSGDVVAVLAVPPATGPRTATLSLVATWNDGSVGPFTIDVPGTVNVTPDPVIGLGVVFGTPTVH